MYKLLLVTNDQTVRDAFSALAWENMGFKPPRMANNAEEALGSLKAHHADAIAIALCHARSSTSLLAQASGKWKVESGK